MRVGIIICDRYNLCEGGKCFRSARNKEGAFKRYKDGSVEVVAYTTCGGCPGGNIENVVQGMKKNGAEAIHFATGVLAGYPPCKYLDTLIKLAEEKTQLPVIVGTHPMPTNYITMHNKLQDWTEEHRNMLEKYDLIEKNEAIKYDSSRSEYMDELQKELSR